MRLQRRYGYRLPTSYTLLDRQIQACRCCSSSLGVYADVLVLLQAGASLASVEGQTSSVNFVVRSRGAYSLSLILARKQPDGSNKPSGCLEMALDPVVNRTGDLWHVCVQVSSPASTLSTYLVI